MQRFVRTALAAAVVLFVGGVAISPAVADCTTRCAEKDADGRCVRFERYCPERNEGDVDPSGSDTKGYYTAKKCYQCIEHYPNGDCRKTKVVDC